jgi:hypothetical protein
MASLIRFRLKAEASWDIDDVLADMKCLIYQLRLTSHDYYETQRQFTLMISRVRGKSSGVAFSETALSNILNDLKEKESITGPCKCFMIVVKNKIAEGTINERCGLKIIGDFALEDEWAGKLIEYLRKLNDKGDVLIDHRSEWLKRLSVFLFKHFTKRGREATRMMRTENMVSPD